MNWPVADRAVINASPLIFLSRCHPRYAGMCAIHHWIPACAGMTDGRYFSLGGLFQTLLYHGSVFGECTERPASMQACP